MNVMNTELMMKRLRAKHLAGASLMVLGLALSAPQAAEAADTTVSTALNTMQIWSSDNFTITGAGSVVVSGGATALWIQNPGPGTLSNAGLISADTKGVYADPNSDIGTISNTGTIHGGFTGVYLGQDSNISVLYNSGTISGQSNGVAFRGTIGTVINEGLITSASDAISGLGNTTVINTGIIEGNISGHAENVFNGGASVMGTYTGFGGAQGEISYVESDVHFSSGLLLLDDNLRSILFGDALFDGATVQMNRLVSISGNMVQSAGSLVFGVTDPTTYASLFVDGDATFTGGSIALKALGAPTFAVGQTYTIVQATGALTDTGLTSYVPGFTSSLSIVPDLGDFDLVLSIDAILSAIQKYDLTAQQMLFKDPILLESLVEAHQALIADAGAAAGSGPARKRIWGAVRAAHVERDVTSASSGYDSNGAGLVVGADMFVGDNAIAGLAVGWQRATGDDKDRLDGTDANIDTYQVTAYGTWRPVAQLSVNGQLTYGFNRIDQHRYISGAGTRADADYNGDQFVAALRVAYDLPLGGDTSLTPFFDLRAIRATTDSFQETGAGLSNLAVSDFSANGITQNLGLKLATSFVTQGVRAEPALSVGWLHDYSDSPLSVIASDGVTPFVVTNDRTAEDGVAVGFHMNLVANDSVTVGVGYDGEFRSDYQANSGNVKLSIKF